MSDMKSSKRTGILREGWTAHVNDYAIGCDWGLNGDVLVVCDALGDIKAFNGKSGNLLWEFTEIHDNGPLATSVNPEGSLIATAGQDGNVFI